MNSPSASPIVTVLLPVYNGERYLREAIESILTQTLESFELLIVDDGSTDGTEAICRSFTDPRVRVHRYEENAGVIFALNTGID
jgi:glycosyltransferase involved in cell wall biosynthesis